MILMYATAVENFSPLLFPVVLIVIMYLMIFLPQKKREKKTRQMLDSLKEGNQIVTIGGLVGKILNIQEEEITIESGIERTKFTIMKWSIKELVEG